MTAVPHTAGPATSKQIGAIHALKSRLDLDDAAYRGLLEIETGLRSAKALSTAQAARVIDRLKGLSGQARSGFESGLPDTLPRAAAPGGAAAGPLRLDGTYAAKLRALWIAAWDLGIVRDRSDAALVSFVARQTGIIHTRWLRDARDAAAVIEALKSWIARESGIVWPGREADPLDLKRAVLTAQWMRLVQLGAVRLFLADKPLHDLERYAFTVAAKQGWVWFDGDDYAAVQAALGRKLRKAIAAKATPARATP
ncbi:regulatory protein GemA [Rhodoplanes sp. TEM]|uniref:Regulatory protein GemA n=1 Tax=Rhodoplanes tepidamans TaxID=200616 RepID=A0ABT5JD04_RHOTP|nr:MULTISPECIES: regulatory protein GemA [Rhodoplanes]MDC7787338.1 regulatory protein GemA [Rhodoplanes tepidamans]MDC7984780.1 regulatory protein GemA [Rhodoplanes sp. TEM]MDQ0358249.1 phage gp16-like protein [Rhodoplanes tepidamans]